MKLNIIVGLKLAVVENPLLPSACYAVCRKVMFLVLSVTLFVHKEVPSEQVWTSPYGRDSLCDNWREVYKCPCRGRGLHVIRRIPMWWGDFTHAPIGKWAVGLQMKGFFVFSSVSISLKILHLGANSTVKKPRREIPTSS